MGNWVIVGTSLKKEDASKSAAHLEHLFVSLTSYLLPPSPISPSNNTSKNLNIIDSEPPTEDAHLSHETTGRAVCGSLMMPKRQFQGQYTRIPYNLVSIPVLLA